MSLTFKKFEKVFSICLMSVISLVILWAIADSFMTRKVDLNNSIKIEVHFKEFEKLRIEGKISYSYNFYIEENDDLYKIVADYTGCFEIDNFFQNIKEGDLIIIYIDKNKGLKNPNLKSIVGIVGKGKNYIDVNCVNDEIEEKKIYMPLIFSILPIILIISFIQKRKKTEKEKLNG
jgi:hypothetical protein